MQAKASNYCLANANGIGTIAFEDFEHFVAISFESAFDLAYLQQLACRNHRLAVVYTQNVAVAAFGNIAFEFIAQAIVGGAWLWLQFVGEVTQVVFKRVDIGEFLVDAHSDKAFHTVACVHQRLLLIVIAEFLDNAVLYMVENLIGILSAAASYGSDNLFEHKNIFNFSHIWHMYFLFSQVFYFRVGASVAVDDAIGVEVVECFQLVKCASGLNHFVATAQRLDLIFGEYERVKF